MHDLVQEQHGVLILEVFLLGQGLDERREGALVLQPGGGVGERVGAFLGRDLKTRQLAAGKVAFVSRGDESGTNKKELQLWYEAGVTTSAATAPTGAWYITAAGGQLPCLCLLYTSDAADE